MKKLNIVFAIIALLITAAAGHYAYLRYQLKQKLAQDLENQVHFPPVQPSAPTNPVPVAPAERETAKFLPPSDPIWKELVTPQNNGCEDDVKTVTLAKYPAVKLAPAGKFTVVSSPRNTYASTFVYDVLNSQGKIVNTVYGGQWLLSKDQTKLALFSPYDKSCRKSVIGILDLASQRFTPIDVSSFIQTERASTIALNWSSDESYLVLAQAPHGTAQDEYNVKLYDVKKQSITKEVTLAPQLFFLVGGNTNIGSRIHFDENRQELSTVILPTFESKQPQRFVYNLDGTLLRQEAVANVPFMTCPDDFCQYP